MKIGFIGLGTMGAPMARNLVADGFDVTVHNRTRSREEGFDKRAATPAEAAEGRDVVVTIVSDTPDVEEVLLGPHGVVHGASSGTLVIDMSTISADATRTFGAKLAAKGVRMIDAPVSGGSEGAQKGTLTIMVGGDEPDVAKALPVLECLGGKVTHIGPLGSGQLTKAVNQVIIAGYFEGVAEGLMLAMKSGLDPYKVVDALSAGMARSAVLEMRARNIIEGDYPLGFKLALHLKDLKIALESGIDLPLAKMVKEIEERLVGEYGNEDMSALAIEARRKAGL
jgi:3-hydroxyisobutyrate dehydrogenase-like beta-hydroxyacid dehydrogenase